MLTSRFAALVLVIVTANLEVHGFRIVSISECEVTKSPLLDGFVSEAVINDDGSLTGKFKAKFDMDDSITVSMGVSTFEDGEWKQHNPELMTMKLCDVISSHLTKLWKRISKELGVEEKCPISAGEYVFENFLVSEDDFDFPLTDMPRLLLDLTVSKDSTPYLCRQLEIHP